MKGFTDYEIAYIAEILDGEGHVTFNTTDTGNRRKVNYTNVIVGIANTDQNLMNFLNRIPNAHFYTTISKNTKCKPVHNFYIASCKDVQHFLKAVYPYLIIKKNRARKAIKFLESQLQLLPESRPIYARFWHMGFFYIWDWMYGEYNW